MCSNCRSFASITLEPGDTLVLYSDGLTEAFNPQWEEFGDARLVARVQGADAHYSAEITAPAFEGKSRIEARFVRATSRCPLLSWTRTGRCARRWRIKAAPTLQPIWGFVLSRMLCLLPCKGICTPIPRMGQ